MAQDKSKGESEPKRQGRKKERKTQTAFGPVAQRNLRIRQDTLRKELAAKNHIHQLVLIDNELRDINDEVRRKTAEDKVAVLDDKAYNVRIKALKARADIQFRKLAKYLPDLKSMEITDPDGNSPVGRTIIFLPERDDDRS